VFEGVYSAYESLVPAKAEASLMRG